MKIKKTDCKYFDSLAYFIISTVSIGLTFEVYLGKAGTYNIKDRIVLDSKQMGKRLILYPYVLLNDLFKKALWPEEIEIKEESRKKPPPEAILQMGPLEIPLVHNLSSMFGNYYENNIHSIRNKFGDFNNWPDSWKFGWAIRNACFHDGCIYIKNRNIEVRWMELSYNHNDNGRPIVNTDMWPADFIYLMMDMDKYL